MAQAAPTQAARRIRGPLSWLLVAVLVAGVALAGLPAPVARAATLRYVALAGNDTGNNCSSSGLPCATLAHALGQAVAGDTIQVAAGAYSVADPATNGNLAIDKSITIQGAGAALTILDGGSVTNVLQGGVIAITNNAIVAIAGVTITGGNTGIAGRGGGIYVDHATLTLTDSAISGNSAPIGTGGGIYAVYATVTLTNSAVSGNHADNGNGGGIFGFAGATVTLTNSTVSGNSTGTFGGGLFARDGNSGSAATMTLTNSTVTGNSATSSGGGIYAGSGGSFALTNTVVSGNGGAGNCAGPIADGGHNLDDGSSCGFSTANSSQSNTPARLGPLQDNGGPTPTLLPQPGSPLLDAGGDTACPATDQRGLARPQGAHCDIGAVEVAASPTPAVADLSPATAVVGSATVTLTVRGAGFAPGGYSTVWFGGTALTTIFISATQLAATIPASLLTSAGAVPVTVITSAPGGGTANTLTFTITNPVPTLTGISPATVTAGSADTAFTLTGTNFVAGLTVDVGGAPLAPSAVTSSQVTVSVPQALLATARLAPVTVTNPAPGGGPSNALPFAITNPAPALTGLSQTTVTAGSGDLALTLTGGDFAPGATVLAGDVALTPGSVTSASIQVTLPAALLTQAGTLAISAVNPGPGGGASNNISLAVNPADAGQVRIVAGNAQSAPVTTTFATALQVEVRDQYGNLAPGASVTFSAPASGASGAFAASATVTADGNGVATAPAFTANGVAGSYTVLASANGAIVPFTLTNAPGPVARFALTAPATAVAASPLTLTVTAQDAQGNTVTGYTGTVHLTSSDGQAALPADSPFTRGDNGRHTVSVTLATAGQQTITATDTADSGISGQTSVAVGVAAPASVGATAGAGQQAPVGTVFAAPLQATVRDASGNPVGGVSVTFRAPASGPSATFGGSLAATVVTDTAGRATAPALTATGAAGAFTVSATASGVATPATFALTNTAAPVPNVTLTVQVAGSGAVTPGVGDHPYPSGGAASLTATAIAQLAARGVIKGYANGQFGPGDLVMRAQAAALIARTFGWQAQFHGNAFPDRCDPSGQQCIDDELWNDVAVLNFYNIARGYNNPLACQAVGTTTPCYQPRGAVLHIQVVSLITRAMEAAGLWTEVAQDDPTLFTDVPLSTGERLDLLTYRRYVQPYTDANGLPLLPALSGTTAFPGFDQPATRGYSAQVIWQAYASYWSANHAP